MKIRSTNTGEKETHVWGNKTFHTGIFKRPRNEPLLLGEEDVVGDIVVDRKHHGGKNKACYLYSADHYAKWRNKYQNLDWQDGMFGENLTVEGFNESEVYLGNIYEVGSALVQVSEPRRPCSALNLKFQSNQMVKEFVDFEHCGAYLRVIKPGHVAAGDEFKLIEENVEKVSLQLIFKLLYKKLEDHSLVDGLLEGNLLTDTTKSDLRKAWNK